jgi:hypothetical protein
VDFLFEGTVGSDTILRSLHTLVCTALDDLTSFPIPAPVRAAFERLAG